MRHLIITFAGVFAACAIQPLTVSIPSFAQQNSDRFRAGGVISVCEVLQSPAKFENRFVTLQGVWNGAELYPYSCNIPERDESFHLLNRFSLASCKPNPKATDKERQECLDKSTRVVTYLEKERRRLSPGRDEELLVIASGTVDSSQPELARSMGFKASIGYGHLGTLRARFIYERVHEVRIAKR